MGAAQHLGIRLPEYDRRIRTFIPHYEDLLRAAGAAIAGVRRASPTVVDLGIGSGALAREVLATASRARIIGIDSDAGMLGLAEKRLRGRLTPQCGDFLTLPLPRCDAITASFALHHVPTRRRKAALYRRCFDAIRPGGVLINGDSALASDPRVQKRDRDAWLSHLEHAYGRRRAAQFLRAWAREDVYFTLDDELSMLAAAGFVVDVTWRRDSFAVIVGTRT